MDFPVKHLECSCLSAHLLCCTAVTMSLQHWDANLRAQMLTAGMLKFGKRWMDRLNSLIIAQYCEGRSRFMSLSRIYPSRVYWRIHCISKVEVGLVGLMKRGSSFLITIHIWKGRASNMKFWRSTRLQAYSPGPFSCTHTWPKSLTATQTLQLAICVAVNAIQRLTINWPSTPLLFHFPRIIRIHIEFSQLKFK
jgi:hypothetical protein